VIDHNPCRCDHGDRDRHPVFPGVRDPESGIFEPAELGIGDREVPVGVVHENLSDPYRVGSIVPNVDRDVVLVEFGALDGHGLNRWYSAQLSDRIEREEAEHQDPDGDERHEGAQPIRDADGS
jgi:hypothetical protein